MGLKDFSSLTSYIKDEQHDVNEFKCLVRNFLYCNTFYTLEECFSYNKSKVLNKLIILFVWFYTCYIFSSVV